MTSYCTGQHDCNAILFINCGTNLDCLLSQVVNGSIWWHVKCKWHFVHVGNYMQKITCTVCEGRKCSHEIAHFHLLVIWKLLGKSCLFWRDEPFRFMKPWNQWFPALKCPGGIQYFSYSTMLRAFGLANKEPLFHFSAIHLRRSTSSSGHAAFLPKFTHFNQGIFTKFPLLLCHKRTLLLGTPNSPLVAWFPCWLAKFITFNSSDTVTWMFCSGEFCCHVYILKFCSKLKWLFCWLVVCLST